MTSTRTVKVLLGLILLTAAGMWFFNRSAVVVPVLNAVHDLQAVPAESDKRDDISIQMPTGPDKRGADQLVQKAASGNVSADTAAKLKTLVEILNAKNDNDPRIDSEFKTLSLELKTEIKNVLNRTRRESLNERGTMLFVLSKDMKSTEDLKILDQVLKESPCLSFKNCTHGPDGPSDSHLDSVNEASLLYPQLVALNRIENLMNQKEFAQASDDYVREIREILQNASISKITRIQQKAQSLLDQLHTRRAQ